MYSCGPNSLPKPVAVANTTVDYSDLFCPKWCTLVTVSDADTVTGIKMVHADNTRRGFTQVSIELTILHRGDAKTFPILEGVLPLGSRVNLFLLPVTSTEEESNTSTGPINWDRMWKTLNGLGKGIRSLIPFPANNGSAAK